MEAQVSDGTDNHLGASEMTWRSRVAMAGKRGREKLYVENLRLSLKDGTIDRIDALLGSKETRLDFIRDAIEREISRRTAPCAGQAPGDDKHP